MEEMKLQQGEMLSNFEIEGFWGELQMTMGKRSGAGCGGEWSGPSRSRAIKKGRKMKLRQGEMLSNFEIEGFWGEVQMTMEKRSGAGSGSAREGAWRAPGRSRKRPGGLRGAFRRRRGRPEGGGHDF